MTRSKIEFNMVAIVAKSISVLSSAQLPILKGSSPKV